MEGRMRKLPKNACELAPLISKDDLSLLIAECTGVPWRWYEKPTLFRPRLWKMGDMLRKISATSVKQQQELSLLLTTGNFVSDLQLTAQAVPRPLTLALFCVLVCWTARRCVGDSKEVTLGRCSTAAEILYSLLR